EVGLPETGVVADELGEGDLEGVGLGAESVEDGFALDAAGVGFEAGERGGGGLPLEGGEEAAAAGGEEVGAEKGLAELDGELALLELKGPAGSDELEAGRVVAQAELDEAGDVDVSEDR